MKTIKNNGIQMVMESQMPKIQMEMEMQTSGKTQIQETGIMLKTVEKEMEKIQIVTEK